MTPETLIHRYFTGIATEAEVAELDKLLAVDQDLRKKLITEAGIDAGLREIAHERLAHSTPLQRKIVSPFVTSLLAVAAVVMIVSLPVLTWAQIAKPKILAKLVSSEDASWKSMLPTEDGSELTKGYLKLTSGIATIRMNSGVKITLEAPAQCTIKGPDLIGIGNGSVLVEVPELEEAFRINTINGSCSTNGTRFSMTAKRLPEPAVAYEVFEGALTVQHETGEPLILKSQESAITNPGGKEIFDGPIPEQALLPTQPHIRIGTDGRCTSVIRNDLQEQIHPELLMTKRSIGRNHYDRKAVFTFQLSEMDLGQLETARIRLNLVDSGIGEATRLAKNNRFLIYAFDAESSFWESDLNWSAVPETEADLELIGSFELRRSWTQGSFGIEGKELVNYLQSRTNGLATFLLVRETQEKEYGGSVHAFASDLHPEASGPILELSLKK